MLLASVGALSTFYSEVKDLDDEFQRHVFAVRLIAKMPTMAAFAYRHSMGLPYVYPNNDLSYVGNFLSILFKIAEVKYEPDPPSRRRSTYSSSCTPTTSRTALRRRWRVVGSALPNPFTSMAAGIAGLYGSLHGGANVAVLKILQRVGSTGNIPDFLKGVKEGDERLMGFGHRVGL